MAEILLDEVKSEHPVEAGYGFFIKKNRGNDLNSGYRQICADMRWAIVDPGASFDCADPRHCTKKDQESARQLCQPMVANTANGQHICGAEVGRVCPQLGVGLRAQ